MSNSSSGRSGNDPSKGDGVVLVPDHRSRTLCLLSRIRRRRRSDARKPANVSAE
jgi:hypothetical protein